MRRAVMAGVMGLVVGACAGDAPKQGAQGNAADSGAAAATADAATATPASAASDIPPGGNLTGVVREQMPVGPYVYVRLETTGGERWAAVNESKVAVGDTLTVYNVMLMENFASPTLNRTFDKIWFGTREPSAGGAPQSAAEMPSGNSMPAPLPGSGHPVIAPRVVAPITRATGADARTIGELWTQKDQLANRTVTVRGVVVKYNGGVMGKNWLHLQDGSGTASAGTNDLTVSSTTEAAMGDTVTVVGTVRLNKDLGAGYKYALLVEDAKVTRR